MMDAFSRSASDFPVGDISEMHNRKISVSYNGDMNGFRTLHLQPEWGMDELLSSAWRRLDLETCPKRAFTSDGMDVSDIMMLADDAMVFVSYGENFVSPVQAGEDLDEPRKGNGLPSVVGGYKVMDALGRGGFGQVRLGVHAMSQERVALKFLPKAEISDMGAAERTTTEMQCLMALHHPNIIRLEAHIDMPGHVVLVFELMEGGDMFHYLCDEPGNRLPDESAAKAVFHQILSGVGHAHNQHICHRDLKLDNVLMAKRNLDCVKVADFGLSGFYQPGKTARTRCGSLNYLAPEVLLGTASAGPPIDVWGLGVILFAMLCGRLPFDGSTTLSGEAMEGGPDLKARDRSESAIKKRILAGHFKLDEGVGPEAKDLVRRMLRLNPDERASIPEIFSHCWLRARNLTSLELQPLSLFGGGGGRPSSPITGPPASPLGSPRLSPLSTPTVSEEKRDASRPSSPSISSARGSVRSPRLRLTPLDRYADAKHGPGDEAPGSPNHKFEEPSPRQQRPLSPLRSSIGAAESKAATRFSFNEEGSDISEGKDSSPRRTGAQALPSIASPRRSGGDSLIGGGPLVSPLSNRNRNRRLQSPRSAERYERPEASDQDDGDLPDIRGTTSRAGSLKAAALPGVGTTAGGKSHISLSLPHMKNSSSEVLGGEVDYLDGGHSPLPSARIGRSSAKMRGVSPPNSGPRAANLPGIAAGEEERGRRGQDAKQQDKRGNGERETNRQNVAANRIQDAYRRHSIASRDSTDTRPVPPTRPISDKPSGTTRGFTFS